MKAHWVIVGLSGLVGWLVCLLPIDDRWLYLLAAGMAAAVACVLHHVENDLRHWAETRRLRMRWADGQREHLQSIRWAHTGFCASVLWVALPWLVAFWNAVA